MQKKKIETKTKKGCHQPPNPHGILRFYAPREQLKFKCRLRSGASPSWASFLLQSRLCSSRLQAQAQTQTVARLKQPGKTIGQPANLNKH